MASELQVAGQRWELPADVDLGAIRAAIYNAVHTAGTGMGGWAEVTVVDGGLSTPLHLYVSPGLPIAITTSPEYDVAKSTF